jgi:ABC-type transport system involved in cytochrome bd biosynthesis fused ATPase/permease subunit
MRTFRLSTNNLSPSGVASMAVAVTGSVACIVLASKNIMPFSHDQLEVVKNYFAHFPPQPRRQIVRPCFLNFINVRSQPILAFCLLIASMNVNWFIAFIHVEEEPPSQNHQYRGHAINAPLTGFLF